MLGSYQDRSTASLVPPLGLEDTLRAAAAEYEQNATFPHPGGLVEDPDGDLVLIFDEYAKF
jgi:hypothetical protein